MCTSCRVPVTARRVWSSVCGLLGKCPSSPGRLRSNAAIASQGAPKSVRRMDQVRVKRLRSFRREFARREGYEESRVVPSRDGWARSALGAWGGVAAEGLEAADSPRTIRRGSWR